MSFFNWRKKGFWFLLPLIVLLPARSVRAQVDLTGRVVAQDLQ